MAQDKSAEVIEFSAARSAAAEETVGEFLARSRNAAGIGLFAVSDAIKIKVDHLAAIEAMRADQLPSVPYAVGFVKSYARFLGLDADALASQFKRELADEKDGVVVAKLEPSSASPSFDAGEGARVASIFAIMAIILFGVWVISQIGRDDGSAPAVDADAPARIVLSNAPVETPRPAPATTFESQPAMIETDLATADTEVEAPTPIIAVDTPIAKVTPQPASQSVAPSPASQENAPGAARSELARSPAPPAEQLEPASSTNSRSDLEQAPAPERQAAPIIVSAELIRAAEPKYPNTCAAGAAELESVTVIFDISAAGRPANARVTNTTNACFNDAALSSLQRWRFSPKTINGEPAVDAAKRATINFRG